MRKDLRRIASMTASEIDAALDIAPVSSRTFGRVAQLRTGRRAANEITLDFDPLLADGEAPAWRWA